MIRDKVRFWAGFAVCVAGVFVSINAGEHIAQHVTGAITMLLGAIMAARHADC